MPSHEQVGAFGRPGAGCGPVPLAEVDRNDSDSGGGSMPDLRLGSLVVEVAGAGAPVVMIHGLGGSSNSFQPMIEAEDPFLFVRPDLPGAGRSAVRPGSRRIGGLVSAVRDVLQRCALSRAHFVAHSMGSLVCLQLAVESPEVVLSLTLYGPVFDPSDGARRSLAERAAVARRDGMAGVADAVIAGSLSAEAKATNPLVATVVRAGLMGQDPAGYAAHCEELGEASVPAIESVRCPTLLVASESDPVAPFASVQRLQRAINGSRIERIDGIGHWPMIEAPRASRQVLHDHLARLVPQLSLEH